MAEPTIAHVREQVATWLLNTRAGLEAVPPPSPVPVEPGVEAVYVALGEHDARLRLRTTVDVLEEVQKLIGGKR